MPAKKKTARRPAPRRRAGTLARTWKETRRALDTAEAGVEKKVKALVRQSGVDTRQATATLKAWRARLQKETRRALRQAESRLGALQARARKEQRALGRSVDEAVQRALAALNIPSRREIHDLGRRVDLLSRRIDKFRR
jgi:hypothetical protein